MRSMNDTFDTKVRLFSFNFTQVYAVKYLSLLCFTQAYQLMHLNIWDMKQNSINSKEPIFPH
jgi:hypothetical protein